MLQHSTGWPHYILYSKSWIERNLAQEFCAILYQQSYTVVKNRLTVFTDGDLLIEIQQLLYSEPSLFVLSLSCLRRGGEPLPGPGHQYSPTRLEDLFSKFWMRAGRLASSDWLWRDLHILAEYISHPPQFFCRVRSSVFLEGHLCLPSLSLSHKSSRSPFHRSLSLPLALPFCECNSMEILYFFFFFEEADIARAKL